jgi:DNA-binding transcriptional regulator YdaS (Cro superfamily)
MMKRYDLSSEAYEAAFAAFQGAVARAAGQTAFAMICKCSQGNISQLLRNRSLLPERFVLKAEAGTGIPRSHLRPDIYPSELTTCSVPDAATEIACDRHDISHRSARA